MLDGRDDRGGEAWRAFFAGCAPDLGGLPDAPEAQPMPIYPGAHGTGNVRATRNKEGVRPVRSNHHDVPGAAFLERGTLEDILRDLFGDLSPAQGLVP